jgi:hypothetical protein
VALYEGLKRGLDPEPPPRPRREAYAPPAQAQAWRRVEARVAEQDEPRAPWMDRLLGSGSTHTLGKAAGQALAGLRSRRDGAPAREARPRETWKPQRMQAVGAGESPVPHGRKGVIRGFLVAGGLAWAVLALRPWQRAGELKVDVSALFNRPAAAAGAAGQAKDPQDTGAEAEQAAGAAAAQAQAEARRLAALPLVAGTGRPLALWQDGSGRWYKVDADGVLAPTASAWAKDCLGLPELRGLAARSEAHGEGRRLKVELPAGLLPLDGAVASETRAVVLSDPLQPVLLTHDGTRCLLGDGPWKEREAHLAMVLADLAARRRRAASIDLSYDDTAVVR